MTPATSSSTDLRGLIEETTLLPEDSLADYTVDGVVPSAVAVPRSVEELSGLMRVASERGLRVVPWGGGTKMSLGNPPSSIDLVVAMTSLNGLIAHAAADLTVSVQAGMTLGGLQERLAEQGQYLPLQVPLPHRSTIGGCLATAVSGPWRLAYGTPRDWLIGSSVVLADGTQAKSGGQVVKNVTGYDLNKLYTGSMGTLAVIVSATFKIAPVPAHSGTVVASFPSIDAAMTASQRLLSLAYLPRALQVVAGKLGPWLPQLASEETDGAYLLAEHAGGAQAVTAKLAETRRLLTEAGALSVQEMAVQETALEEPADRGLWQAVTDLGWDDGHPETLLLRAVPQPSQLPFLVSAVQSGPWAPGRMAADPGYGLLRMHWPGDGEALSPEQMVDVINHLRGWTVSIGGYLVVERCPLSVKEQTDVWGEVEGGALMHRIKQRLDPQGILNPSRFVAGI